MKTRILKYVLTSLLGLFFLTFAQVSKAQAVSDWFPVPAKPPGEAKKSKIKSVGRTELKVRSTLPRLDSQSPATTGGSGPRTLNTTGPNTPTINEVVIGPCCDCNRILLDGLYLYQNVTLSLFSSTPNTTVPVTLGHGGPGRIGFSLNLNGPYIDSLDFNVNTDSNGTGSSLITFYIKGLDAGQSNMVTTVSQGFTNPVPTMEVFACQCPPAP